MSKGININFAHRTCRWDSEASIKAHVHCIIVGFSYINRKTKIIYENQRLDKANNINAYLVDGPIVFVESCSKPICNIPKMDFGSMPNDGGYLSDYSKEQKEDI